MSNLVQNPGFESSTPSALSPDWYGENVITVNNSSNAHSGNNYASMTPTTNDFAHFIQEDIATSSSTDYELKFWANPGSSSAKSIVVFGWDFGDEIALSNTNTWTEYTIPFTAFGTNTIFFITYYDGTDNETRIDDISITAV